MDNSRFSKITHIADLIICSVWLLLVAHEEISGWMINPFNLSERKDIMLQRSDILVALPGGVGTLDEIFHVMAAATIGYHKKRVVLYNVNGFWNGLLSLLEEMARGGFVRCDLDSILAVAGNIEELNEFIMEV